MQNHKDYNEIFVCGGKKIYEMIFNTRLRNYLNIVYQNEIKNTNALEGKDYKYLDIPYLSDPIAEF